MDKVTERRLDSATFSMCSCVEMAQVAIFEWVACLLDCEKCEGSGFMVEGLGFRVLWFRYFGFRVYGLGFELWGVGFTV